MFFKGWGYRSARGEMHVLVDVSKPAEQGVVDRMYDGTVDV